MTLRESRTIAGHALARAEELGIEVSIAIVDEAGHLVAAARMDGAGFATPEIAWGKAWTAVAFGVSSATVAERFEAAPTFAAGVAAIGHGRFVPRQGAVLLPGGGAIGVSGGTSQQDEEIAQAGADGLAPDSP